jgi:hypothetical protein
MAQTSFGPVALIAHSSHFPDFSSLAHQSVRTTSTCGPHDCSPACLPPRPPELPLAWPAPPNRALPWDALPCSTVEEVKHHPYLLYSPHQTTPDRLPFSPLVFDVITEAIEAALTNGRCSPSPTPHLTTVTLQKASHTTPSFPTTLCRSPHHFSRFQALCL